MKVVGFVFTFLVLQAQGQQCGVSNLPSFQDTFEEPLSLNCTQQVIITSYQFTCCGVVTEWGVYFNLSEGNDTSVHILPTFQVWRPIGETVYELVGENAYKGENFTENGHLRVTAINPKVQFQRGDVVGYYLETSMNSSGYDILSLNSSRHKAYCGPQAINGTLNVKENMLASTLTPILHIAIANRSCSNSTPTVSPTKSRVTTSTSLLIPMVSVTSDVTVIVTRAPSSTTSDNTGTAPGTTSQTSEPGNSDNILIVATVSSLSLVFLLVSIATISLICLGLCIKKKRKGNQCREDFVECLNEGVNGPSSNESTGDNQQKRVGLESENPMFCSSIQISKDTINIPLHQSTDTEKSMAKPFHDDSNLKVPSTGNKVPASDHPLCANGVAVESESGNEKFISQEDSSGCEKKEVSPSKTEISVHDNETV